MYGNCSVGLRIHCASENMGLQAKILLPKAIFNGFLLVTVRVLNSYNV